MKKVLSFLVLAMAFGPLWLTAENSSETPSLTVSGEAEVRVEPDQATVRLGVVARERTAADSQQHANRIVSAITGAIEDLGVERKALQTSELSLNPLYEDSRGPRSEPPRIVGYEARYTISARLDDLSLVGPAIDAGLQAGANRLEGVQFSLQDDSSTRADALAQATTNAVAKAGILAEAAGVELVRLLSVNEGGVSTNLPQATYRYAMAEQAQSTPVLPGTMTISASVSLRYQIRDRE